MTEAIGDRVSVPCGLSPEDAVGKLGLISEQLRKAVYWSSLQDYNKKSSVSISTGGSVYGGSRIPSASALGVEEGVEVTL
ncbi:hypothetical protein APTSU1_001171800 [Apodemus speciosus]|uniref:Uncharacterized protein n=1 Tax=Apodemus speciosus TaxID=105296 RepID=A0ABQ0FB58_APOSI